MMENDCMDGRLSQLIESIDDKIRAVALNANVSYEDLRNGYVMSCLHITKPFEYNISNLKAKQKIKSEMVTGTEKYKDKTIEQPAVDDNITIQVQEYNMLSLIGTDKNIFSVFVTFTFNIIMLLQFVSLVMSLH
ncbi:unnamed protein product [Brugia timori]|uniref:Dynein light chain n=1 Tax=Brugia timori TaxID=42155 RepID=A0A0R3R1T5_9BILA|nr:unnamed protein product [Brugia timori]